MFWHGSSICEPQFFIEKAYSRISESLFITACSMDDHDEEKKTEQIYLYAAVNLKRK